MSEAEEQLAVIEYCDLKHIPIYHVPNEGKRSRISGNRLKQLGLRSGIPDLCVPVPKGGYGALYIEMKSQTGRPTKDQAQWIKRLRDYGNCAYVCNGAKSAIELIDAYMGERVANPRM